jgi:hypothetical protein
VAWTAKKSPLGARPQNSQNSATQGKRTTSSPRTSHHNR